MAVNPQDATEVVPYLTSAATIVYIQKFLKSRQAYATFVHTFPGADKYAHWFMAGTMSLIASAGIHAVWNGSLTEGGTITIAVPTLLTMLHGTSDWFKVYILQHTVYSAIKEPPYHPPPPKVEP